jgi:hypothetical protein
MIDKSQTVPVVLIRSADLSRMRHQDEIGEGLNSLLLKIHRTSGSQNGADFGDSVHDPKFRIPLHLPNEETLPEE